jgi:hypothetical protein
MGECMTWKQSMLEHTHPIGLMQYLTISGREWESMLIGIITGSSRVQQVDSIDVAFDQFMHFLVISLEVTKLSSGEMFKFYEQLIFISSDRDRLPFLIFEIEYGSGLADHEFTWLPMSTTFHGSRFIPYRYVNMEFQERRMQSGIDGQIIMIRVMQR